LRRTLKGKPSLIETPATGSLILRLSDELLDLDKPIRVIGGGKTIFEGSVKRSFTAIWQSLLEREDPQSACAALLPVSW